MKNLLKHKTRGPILWLHLIFLKLVAIKTIVFNIAALKVLVINSAFLMGLFQFVPHITLAAGNTVDISVSNLVDPTVVGINGTVAMQYFYKNESNPYTAADGVVMTVTLPNGFSALGSSPSWNSQNGNTFTYNIPNGSGEFMVYFNAQHVSGPEGMYENTVSVVGLDEDPYLSNNSASSSVLVIANPEQTVDLAITDVSSAGSFVAGGSVSYTISYQNLSAHTAYGVNIYWDADSFFVGGAASMGYIASGSVYNRSIPSLAPGAAGSITINGTISPLAPSAYSLETYVTIDGTLDDTNTSNNYGSTSDTLGNVSTVEVVSNTSSLCLGSHYSMDILFDTERLRNAYIDVTFPSAIDFVDASSAPTLVGDRTYRWSVNGDTSLGLINFNVEAVGTSVAATITATLGHDEDSNVYTSNTVFSSYACNNQNGGGNNGGGNQGSNNGGGDNVSNKSNQPSLPTSSPNIKTHNAANNTFVKLQCIDEDGQIVYDYARSNGITTMEGIVDARLCDEINRFELAKMLSNYIQNVLKLEPDTSRKCEFSDAYLVKNPTDREYLKTACQLGVMGLKYDGTPDTVFNPYNKVTRDIFATAFSRLLYKDANNGNKTCWYCWHILALEKAKILTHANPKIVELRSFIILMMMRADQNRNK